MRSALAPLAALLAGFSFGLLLAHHQPSALAQGKGGGKGGGGNVHCAIDSLVPVAFGLYDADVGGEQTSTGQLRFSCKPANKTITATVSIGPSGVTGSITDRAMRGVTSGDELHYNLFQDQRASVIWGDGLAGGSPLSVTGAGSFSLEIYGIASPNQPVSEDFYGDALEITIDL